MKTTKKTFWLICSFIAIFLSCSDDDEDSKPAVDSTPEFQSLQEEISSLPGEILVFKATVNDPAGISAINIKYEEWFLDKTIIKDDNPESYEISYQFKVPEDAIENSVHTIPVKVTNVGGKETVKNVQVTLNLDITFPQIDIVSPINQSTALLGDGNEIEFNINVIDNSLSEFKIEGDLLNETVVISGTEYNYSKALNVQMPGTYTFDVTATDMTGNSTTESISVNVITELFFDVMYITDVTDNDALQSDIFGIPYTTVASTVAGEDGYVFTAKFYAAAPNTEVRFLPQKSSFEPFAFGANPDIPGELMFGADASVSPIILPQMGYYEIKMDLSDQSYTLTPYSPTDDTFEQVYIIGTGIYIDSTTSTCNSNVDGSLLCWNFQSGKPFDVDVNNPYLWSIDVRLIEEPNNDGENGFILNANPDGWSPFWRFDDGIDPEATVPNGGVNFIFPVSALDKDYTFVFDTHLNRISAVQR